jgi:hypothetical protein
LVADDATNEKEMLDKIEDEATWDRRDIIISEIVNTISTTTETDVGALATNY